MLWSYAYFSPWRSRCVQFAKCSPSGDGICANSGYGFLWYCRRTQQWIWSLNSRFWLWCTGKLQWCSVYTRQSRWVALRQLCVLLKTRGDPGWTHHAPISAQRACVDATRLCTSVQHTLEAKRVAFPFRYFVTTCSCEGAGFPFGVLTPVNR